jgi:hypothetical protein
MVVRRRMLVAVPCLDATLGLDLVADAVLHSCILASKIVH